MLATRSQDLALPFLENVGTATDAAVVPPSDRMVKSSEVEGGGRSKADSEPPAGRFPDAVWRSLDLDHRSFFQILIASHFAFSEDSVSLPDKASARC